MKYGDSSHKYWKEMDRNMTILVEVKIKGYGDKKFYGKASQGG